MIIGLATIGTAIVVTLVRAFLALTWKEDLVPAAFNLLRGFGSSIAFVCGLSLIAYPFVFHFLGPATCFYNGWEKSSIVLSFAGLGYTVVSIVSLVHFFRKIKPTSP